MLITSLDQSVINYETTATYTYDVSFNGIEGEITSSKVVVRLPNYLEFTIGNTRLPIKNVTTEVIGNNNEIIFDFGAIEDLGISARMEIEVKFKFGTETGTKHMSDVKLFINGLENTIAESTELTLLLEGNFQINIARVLPKIDPASGGGVIFKVTLENFGDKGAKILNTILNGTLENSMILDNTFQIIGKDISTGEFIDKSQDGIIGIVNGNNYTFTIPEYTGYKYTFLFRAVLKENLEIGTHVETYINWTIDGETQDNGTEVITLNEKIFNCLISEYGPEYTLQNRNISYEFYVLNDGNQTLENIRLVEYIPSEVIAYEFKTGTFWIADIEKDSDSTYSIQYTTSGGITGKINNLKTNENKTIDLTTLIPQNDQLLTLVWEIPEMRIGVTNKQPPTINGIVKSNVNNGTRIISQFDGTWATDDGIYEEIQNTITIAEDLSVINPMFNRFGNEKIYPSDIITYDFVLNCMASRIDRPILATLLPLGTEFVEIVDMNYTPYFDNALAMPQPKPLKTQNFNNTNRELIQIRFENDNAFEFNQRDSISIRFSIRVKDGVSGVLPISMVIGNASNSIITPDNVNIYRDFDIIGNGDNALYALSKTVNTRVEFFPSIASDKKVKGKLDNAYHESPEIGKTLEGGTVEYNLQVKNTGNADIISVEIIDILPHIGDTGVILTTKNRGTQFPIYNINKILAKVIRSNTSEPAEVNIQYSKSYNPIRFGNSFNTVGVDNDWTTNFPPIDTDLKSFKVTTKNTTLHPLDVLDITMQGIVPVGSIADEIAWNSFAIRASYVDKNNLVKSLLATESEKVGVKIENPPKDTAKISGIIFEDINNNGIFDENDNNLDDQLIIICNQNKQMLLEYAVATTPNKDGESGHYLINNLPYGTYYLRIVINDTYYQFSPLQQQINGYIGPFVINQTNNDLSINVALVPREKSEKISTILEANKDANKMVKQVIYNTMLINSKLEDVKEIIENG